MNSIDIIRLCWTCFNGFVLEILYLDLYKPFNVDGSLFGINVSKKYLYIDIFWINIKIFDKDRTNY